MLMEYGIYAAIFILLLGAVALVVWGTRKTGSKEQVMTSLDKLEATTRRRSGARA
jgi:hypothetical protein